jgi:predicted nucleic acid-binding protein
MQRIYLDACAINRLTDDQSQPRVSAEANAVLELFRLVGIGRLEWLASPVLAAEIQRNPDPDRRQDALFLLSFAREIAPLDASVFVRAQILEALGYGAFDSLHLAAAEHLEASVFITTDDRFLRQARRGLGKPRIEVENPVKWLQKGLL